MAKTMKEILGIIEDRGYALDTANAFVLAFQDFDFSGLSTRMETIQFLRECMKRTDGKHGNIERQAAKQRGLGELIKMVHSGPSKYFEKLNVHRVAYHLALRILEPRRINQRDFGLCGPSHFLILHCKAHPDDYARMALELWTLGRFSWGDAVIKPHRKIFAYVPEFTIAEGDWMMAASVRNSSQDPSTIGAKGREQYEETKPQQVFDWLKQAGYRQVIQIGAFENGKFDDWLASKVMSKAYLQYHPKQPDFMAKWPNPHQPYQNLKLARHLLENGWRVMMVIYADWCAYVDSSKETVAAHDSDARPKAEKEFQQMIPTLAKLGEGDRQDILESIVKAKARVTPHKSKEAIMRGIVDEWKSMCNGLINIPSANHWILAKEISIDGSEREIKVHRYTWGAKEWTKPFPLQQFLMGYSGFVAARD